MKAHVNDKNVSKLSFPLAYRQHMVAGNGGRHLALCVKAKQQQLLASDSRLTL